MATLRDESDWVVTRAELAHWTQQASIGEDDELANGVLWGATVLVREAGSESWTHDTIPDRPRLIAIMVARNYYSNPDSLIAEGVGPLSERRAEDVVRAMTLTEDERDILGQYGRETDAEPDQPVGFGDLQVLTTTRGPVETRRGRRRSTMWLRDEDGSYLPYADAIDAGAFGGG